MSEFLSKVRNRLGRKSSPREGILPLYEIPPRSGASIVNALELNQLVAGQPPQRDDHELSGVVVNGQAGPVAPPPPPLSPPPPTHPLPPGPSEDEPLPPPPHPSPPPPPPPSPTNPNEEVAADPTAHKLRLTHIEYCLDSSRNKGLTLTAGKTEDEPRTTRICSALRQAIFWTFVTASLAQGVKSSKFEGLIFLQQRTLSNFLDLSNFTMLFVVGLSFVIFFLIKEQALTRFRKALRRRKEEDLSYNPTSDTMVKWSVGIFQVTSLVTAVVAQLESGRPLDEWTADGVMYYHAYHFAMGLFWWRAGNGGDVVDFVNTNYAKSASGTRTAFAVSNIFLGFAAFLMLSLLRDILDCLAITMFLESRRSAELCKVEDNEIVDEATAVIQCRSTLSMKLLSDEYNRCYRGELKLVIIMEIFAWTYLLQEQLEDEIFFIYALVLAINALKTLLFFILSVMTNKYGKKCQRAMKRISRKYKVLEVDGRMIRIDLLVDDLTTHPIAIGRGAFQITEAFFLAFLTSVWTFFTIVAQARGKAGPSKLIL